MGLTIKSGDSFGSKWRLVLQSSCSPSLAFDQFLSLVTSKASPNGGREENSPMKAGNPWSPRLKKGGILPSIPSATLTGIRTFIRGEGRTMTLDTQERDELKKANHTVRGYHYDNSTIEEARIPWHYKCYQSSNLTYIGATIIRLSPSFGGERCLNQ